ncbi:MAG: UvrD-helicase domain-containing protein [Deltaproteobacteria bacterium]|nr:UvrD-helicase domain-containing protein [Deltaproteobacteria bacterium]
MMFVPSDQPIREKIILDQNNQLIIAGAGSGKTTLIVDKYVHLIEKGFDPEKIVAITFTNQSADELKLRIAQKFQTQFPDRPPIQLSSLPIATIHGFCNRIVQNYAYQFGYLPGFQVEHEYMYQRLQDCLADSMPRLYAQHPSLTIWKLLGWFSFHHIYQWMLDLFYKNLHFTLPPKNIPTPALTTMLDTLDAQLIHCLHPEDALLLRIQFWIKQAQAFDPTKPLTWSSIMNEKIPAVSRLGNQKNWGNKEMLQAVRAQFSDFLMAIENLRSVLSHDILGDLSFLYTKLQDRYLAYKKDLQIVEPDDLLTYVRYLLQDPKTWQEITSQIDYIFVDEFQDTDPLQTEIVMRLIAKNYPDRANWQDIDIDAKLTVVGDPQQSIYRFRDASIETFLQAQAMIQQQQGQTYNIVQNFRSDPPVIDFVNDHFTDMTHFSPLTAKPTDQQFPVDILTDQNFSDKSSLEDARQTDAKLIRTFLQEFFANQTVFTPKDCVLLFPTFSHVDIYEREIGQDFPVLKQRKSHHLHPFFVSLLTVLQYFEDPATPYHLQSLLRTPFFFHTLQEMQIFLSKPEPTLHDIDDANLRHTINTLTEKFQQSIYFGMQAFASALTNDLTSEEISILQWTLQEIFLYEAGGLSSLPLLQFLQDRFAEHFVPSHGNDQTIRMMTMHQSKGLEFPIVVLAGLYTQAFKGQSYYTNPATGATEISFPPFSDWLTTPHFAAIKETEKKALLEEKRRLLYVACTRAKHHLVISKLPVQSRQKTYADLLWSTAT